MTFADPVSECWAHIDIPSLLDSAGLKGQCAFICQLQTSLEVCTQTSPKNPNFLLNSPCFSWWHQRALLKETKSSLKAAVPRSYSLTVTVRWAILSFTLCTQWHSSLYQHRMWGNIWHCLIQSISLLPSLALYCFPSSVVCQGILTLKCLLWSYVAYVAPFGLSTGENSRLLG